MNQKAHLHSHCLSLVQQRIANIEEEIKKIQVSANSETKSSAGDKYETGRAMAQLEIERGLGQLVEAKGLKVTLQQIEKIKITGVVLRGALVTTSQNIFYIAISLGLVEFDSKKYFVVSPESPIGKLLIGKRVGDVITWNSLAQEILGIE
jgi:transcription elongation GreA/GreB family factor